MQRYNGPVAARRTEPLSTHRRYTETMGFKTISLSDSVYKRLRSEKRPRESFNEVITRLLDAKQPPLAKYAGAWKPLSATELSKIRGRIDRLRHGTPVR